MPCKTKFRRKINKYTLEFSDSEGLIKSAAYLRNKRLFKSRLYRINNSYRLLIESIKETDDFFTVKEFCNEFYSGDLHFEYTEEYGLPIITERAVSKLARVFFKDF